MRKVTKAAKSRKKSTLPEAESTARVAHVKGHHPSHSSHLPRLNRVKGQVDGIERMISEGRYCLDIIAQLRAAASALKAIEAEVFKAHLRGCVKEAFSGKDIFNSEEKIQEIIKLIY